MNKILEKMLATGKIPTTMLFAGSGGEEGADTFASRLCGPVDIHHYRTEGKSSMHSMDSMQGLIKQVYLPPYASPYKVLIIHDAHRMLPTSSNALLKTLEEPILDTVIILTTTEPKTLLPTILSRCAYIPFFTKQESLPREWQPLLIKFLNEKSPAAFTKLEVHFSALKEAEEGNYYSEVDELFKHIFLYYRENTTICLENLADRIEECREAIQLHMKFRNVMEYLCVSVVHR